MGGLVILRVRKSFPSLEAEEDAGLMLGRRCYTRKVTLTTSISSIPRTAFSFLGPLIKDSKSTTSYKCSKTNRPSQLRGTIWSHSYERVQHFSKTKGRISQTSGLQHRLWRLSVSTKPWRHRSWSRSNIPPPILILWAKTTNILVGSERVGKRRQLDL